MTKKDQAKDIAFRVASKLIRDVKLYKLYKYKDDSRPTAPFKLVFFCGKSGIVYLNASLFSVYRSWKYLPDIVIVSDGTPTGYIERKLINWPRKVTIISWEQCAIYCQEYINKDLYIYATEELWGKKFTSILYCAKHFPTLYADTDVLWYNSPFVHETSNRPVIKMSQDVDFHYTSKIVEYLNEKNCYHTTPFNAGIIYLYGDFSSYPNWSKLCKFLADNRKLGGFSEQTANAILNNYFDKSNYWNQQQFLIKIDDNYSFKNTIKLYPEIIARHYVNLKNVAFWRDFLYMCMSKKNQVLNEHKDANVLLYKV